MEVFDLREQVVGEYTNYVKSFVRIRDAQIRNLVESELAGRVLCPSPLVQLDPVRARRVY